MTRNIRQRVRQSSGRSYDLELKDENFEIRRYEGWRRHANVNPSLKANANANASGPWKEGARVAVLTFRGRTAQRLETLRRELLDSITVLGLSTVGAVTLSSGFSTLHPNELTVEIA